MRRHGTASCYSGGCRCDDCRRAVRDKKRRERGSVLARTPLVGESWRAEAACHGMDPEVFFPISEAHSQAEARWARDAAVRICQTCPVTDPCLNHALDWDEADGVWGATTPDDRKSLHRLRRRKAAQAVELEEETA